MSIVDWNLQSKPMMQIKVLFFARAGEIAGARHTVLVLREGSTVDAAVGLIAERFPGLVDLLPSCRFAVDEEFASGSDCLQENSTLAVIPPVSGG